MARARTYRNIPHSKKVTYNGLKFDSVLEKDFYIACQTRGIKVQRAESVVINDKITLDTFSLYNKGKFVKSVRKQIYTPDFYLPEYDYIIEVKGVDTPEFRRRFSNFLHHNYFNGEHNVAVLYNRFDFNDFFNKIIDNEIKPV